MIKYLEISIKIKKLCNDCFHLSISIRILYKFLVSAIISFQRHRFLWLENVGWIADTTFSASHNPKKLESFFLGVESWNWGLCRPNLSALWNHYSICGIILRDWNLQIFLSNIGVLIISMSLLFWISNKQIAVIILYLI